MSRTVSFPCPVCGRKHIGEPIYGKQTTCNGQTIVFNQNWEPSTMFSSAKHDRPVTSRPRAIVTITNNQCHNIDRISVPPLIDYAAEWLETNYPNQVQIDRKDDKKLMAWLRKHGYDCLTITAQYNMVAAITTIGRGYKGTPIPSGNPQALKEEISKSNGTWTGIVLELMDYPNIFPKLKAFLDAELAKV